MFWFSLRARVLHLLPYHPERSGFSSSHCRIYIWCLPDPPPAGIIYLGPQFTKTKIALVIVADVSWPASLDKRPASLNKRKGRPVKGRPVIFRFRKSTKLAHTNSKCWSAINSRSGDQEKSRRLLQNFPIPHWSTRKSEFTRHWITSFRLVAHS